MADGDELTCTSNVDLASYSFTDDSGTVTDGGTLTLDDDGTFTFTCTASVPTDPPCSLSGDVTVTVVGKKQLNII